jgi:hypothetical protein
VVFDAREAEAQFEFRAEGGPAIDPVLLPSSGKEDVKAVCFGGGLDCWIDVEL